MEWKEQEQTRRPSNSNIVVVHEQPQSRYFGPCCRMFNSFTGMWQPMVSGRLPSKVSLMHPSFAHSPVSDASSTGQFKNRVMCFPQLHFYSCKTAPMVVMYTSIRIRNRRTHYRNQPKNTAASSSIYLTIHTIVVASVLKSSKQLRCRLRVIPPIL
jgi:hypothetical protein